jgi:NAD(P)H-dependent FMN reductase
MIEIIAGTDRQNSLTSKIAQMLLADYRALQVPAEMIDLSLLDFKELAGANYKTRPGQFSEAVERVTRAEGVVMVVPEYNGSFPGALKLFIDYWRYPDTFENRPFAFVGLGTRWGGLRPVEHLQQVLGYRNGYIFPNRVFISHVKNIFKDGKIQDQLVDELLKTQSRDFIKFIRALKDEGLDANSRLKR